MSIFTTTIPEWGTCGDVRPSDGATAREEAT